jgi:hypothetical protein
MVADGGLSFRIDPDQPLDPESLGIEVRGLSAHHAVVLAVTIGLCWVDRDGHPYPGLAVPEQAVVDGLEAVGGRASPHTTGALRNLLPAAGLIVRGESAVRLGPVIAGWNESDVAALRRVQSLLPPPYEDGEPWASPSPPLSPSPLAGPAPNGSRLQALSVRDQGAVLDAVRAVEWSDEPVPAAAFGGLADPALRAAVADCLAVGGRCLVEHQGGRWTSGYDDAVWERLVTEGIGSLQPVDAAVLTLVLLHTVAIPRSAGRTTGDRWCDAAPVTVDELAKNRHLGERQIRASVRRLKDAGILRPGHRSDIVPGPQFERLTPRQSQRLWEDLIVAVKPDSPEARRILFRRGERS